MPRTGYSFPAALQRQADGSILVRFPDLPKALMNGATEAEALAEAADCLSEALAGRIRCGEPVPALLRRSWAACTRWCPTRPSR